MNITSIHELPVVDVIVVVVDVIVASVMSNWCHGCG